MSGDSSQVIVRYYTCGALRRVIYYNFLVSLFEFLFFYPFQFIFFRWPYLFPLFYFLLF